MEDATINRELDEVVNQKRAAEEERTDFIKDFDPQIDDFNNLFCYRLDANITQKKQSTIFNKSNFEIKREYSIDE